MLTGCDKSSISIGMIGNKMPYRISYHFHLFSDKNGTVKVKNEQIINIEYKEVLTFLESQIILKGAFN